MLVTTQHKHRDSEERTCVFSQFLWVTALDVAYLGPLLRVSRGCEQDVSGAASLSGALVLFLAPVSAASYGTVQFLAVVGLGPQLPEATTVPCTAREGHLTAADLFKGRRRVFPTGKTVSLSLPRSLSLFHWP